MSRSVGVNALIGLLIAITLIASTCVVDRLDLRDCRAFCATNNAFGQHDEHKACVCVQPYHSGNGGGRDGGQ